MAMYNRLPKGNNPLNNWIGILIGIGLLVVLFLVVRGIVRLLYFVAPLLLIATLIINYRVVIDYLKRLGSIFRENLLWGLGATALTVVFYPFVFAILLVRALGYNTRQRFFGNDNSEEEYVDYEILDDDDALDLDEFEKVQRREKRTDTFSGRE